MKFGMILAVRRSEDWRCIAYSSLKQHIKSADCSAESVRLFHEALANEIAEVDSFFQKMRTDLDVALTKSNNLMSPTELRQHAVLNYLAVLKILKKHGKTLHNSSEASEGEFDFAAEALVVTKQRLFSSSFFTALKSGTDLFIQDDREVPCGRASVTFEQCPICLADTLDPAELPCGHSFCWACLANCAAHSMSTCPLCRKEQSLDPVNLQIETILGCLAHSYYPTNQPEVSDASQPGSLRPGSFDDESTVSPLCSPRGVGPLGTPRSAVGSRSPRLAVWARTPSPATPRVLPRRSVSPPSLRPPPPEPLLKALRMNSQDRVRAALAKEPGVARELFFESGLDPPLCAALRLGCSVGVIRLLLDAGADARATTISGHSSLHLLSSGVHPRLFDAPPEDFDNLDPLTPGGISATLAQWVVQYEKGAALALLAAHADPEGEVLNQGASSTSVELARGAGKEHLVQLYLNGCVPEA